MNAPMEPGLDKLVRALTADSQPGELAGRDAALAAFRAANQPAQAPVRRRRSLRAPLTARLAAVMAAGAAVVAGFTAAAYAQALPSPVQQIAHSVLAPIGVPDSRSQRPNHQVSPLPGATKGSSGPAGVTIATPGTRAASAGASPRSSAPGTGRPSHGPASPTPSPAPAAAGQVTLSAARARVPADAVDVFTGRVTRPGQAAADVRVRLQMRVAGTTTWQDAGTSQTGEHGYYRLTSPVLTATAAFRVVLPDGGHSASVRVTVGLPVRIRLVAGPVRDRLVVTAKAARPGDTAVLQELVNGAWTTIRSKPLGPKDNAVFTVTVRAAGGQSYRGAVLISGTPAPGAAVQVPATANSGGISGAGEPTPVPSATPTASVTPAQTPAPTATPTSAGPSATATQEA